MANATKLGHGFVAISHRTREADEMVTLVRETDGETFHVPYGALAEYVFGLEYDAVEAAVESALADGYRAMTRRGE